MGPFHWSQASSLSFLLFPHFPKFGSTWNSVLPNSLTLDFTIRDGRGHSRLLFFIRMRVARRVAHQWCKCNHSYSLQSWRQGLGGLQHQIGLLRLRILGLGLFHRPVPRKLIGHRALSGKQGVNKPTRWRAAGHLSSSNELSHAMQNSLGPLHFCSSTRPRTAVANEHLALCRWLVERSRAPDAVSVQAALPEANENALTR